SQSLERLGRQAEPALKKALAGAPSAEARSRVQVLLDKLSGPAQSNERLRRQRALTAMEQMGSREARQVSEALTKGPADDALTAGAKAALRRLERRRGCLHRRCIRSPLLRARPIVRPSKPRPTVRDDNSGGGWRRHRVPSGCPGRG